MSKKKRGTWDFKELRLADKELFADYIGRSEYPANRFSSHFAFLYANSRKPNIKILWKIVDDMLVTFAYTQKGQLYLACLPFGAGDAEKVVDVLIKSLQYCYARNNYNIAATKIDTVNRSQLDFLRASARFDRYFQPKMLEGREVFFGIQNLLTLSGKDLYKIRKKIRQFNREYPQAVIRAFQLSDYEQLLALKTHWNQTSGKKYFSVGDDIPYRTILKNFHDLDHIVMVAEIDGKIAGMASGGPLPQKLSWVYFHKTMLEYKGLAEVMYVEMAKEVNRMNPAIEVMNVGNDSGIGLSVFKQKFQPVQSLERFAVYPKIGARKG